MAPMAQDRDDRLGSGFPSQLVEAAGRPILASVTTVTDLLRSFVSDAIERRGQYLEGKITGPEASSKDVEQARALADLLNGKGPRAAEFFVQPWNSPEQMGAHLRETYDLQCSEEEAALTVLVSMLTEVYNTMEFLTSDQRPVEENGWMIEGIIEMYVAAILDLAWDADA